MSNRCHLGLCALLLLSSLASGQSLDLLEDVNATPPLTLRPDPFAFTEVGGQYVFLTRAGEDHAQPWVSDGTVQGTKLLRDLAVPAAPRGRPGRLGIVRTGKVALFFADDGVHGIEPWITYGNSLGTAMLADLSPGRASTHPMGFVAGNGRAFFEHAGELWVSDGTPTGTYSLTANGPTAIGLPIKGTARGCWFTARTPAHGRELWFSDGTRAGTKMVADWTPGTYSTTFNFFSVVEVNGGIAYEAVRGSPTYGTEQIVTDGTAQGTYLLSGPNADQKPRVVLQRHFDGKQVWLAGQHETRGRCLWISDLTKGSLRLLQDRNQVLVDPVNFFDYGQLVGFVRQDAATGRELWVSDGTSQGTRILFEFEPGPASKTIVDARLDARGLFVATWEGLYLSDGTKAGTRRLASFECLPVGWADEPPRVFEPTSDGKLFLSVAIDGVGNRLATTDGTVAGTTVLADTWTGPTRGSDPRWGTQGLGRFFFLAYGAEGEEVWRTRSRPRGAELLVDLLPGSKSSMPTGLLAGAGALWFTANHPTYGHELFRSNGTASGTHVLGDLAPPGFGSLNIPLATLGKKLLFTSYNQQREFGYYSTEGTIASMRKVFPTSIGAPANPSDYRVAGGRIWFPGGGASPGLFVTDLSTTTRLSDAKGKPVPRSLPVHLGGTAFFVAEDDQKQEKIWKSDGTVAGTVPFLDSGEHLTTAHELLFFERELSPAGHEIWVTDGTKTGTARVHSSPASVRILGALSDRIVFQVSQGGGKYELWTTDGSATGTSRFAKDLSPRIDFQAFPVLALGARRFVFQSEDTAHGIELWVSDATASGTRLLRDALPGAESSNPRVFGVYGGGLAFAVLDTPEYGREPHIVRYGAGQNEMGQGCGRSGSKLVMDDPVLGTSAQIEGLFAPKNSVGVLLLGALDASPQLFFSNTCLSYVDPSQVWSLTAFAVLQPKWQQLLPIPNDARLVDFECVLPAFYLRPGEALEGTQAIHARLGR